MPLPSPSPRRHLHTRSIHCEGFLREDGLWDIEARIHDTKSYAYTEPWRGRVEAGRSVHDMSVRLTVDRAFVVRDIAIATDASPYPDCSTSGPNFRELIGRSLMKGWRQSVREAVGGAKGCTHVRELLSPMATVAYQTVNGWAADDGSVPVVIVKSESGKPAMVDGCIAWRSDGEVVAKVHPEFATRG